MTFFKETGKKLQKLIWQHERSTPPKAKAMLELYYRAVVTKTAW
jgi:hypothetical protein